MSIILKEIEDFNSLEFEKSLTIYQSSFPPNETRSIAKLIAMLKDDENYHLFIVLHNNSVIGLSLLYIFKTLKVGLLDYMAISPSYQRKGIGKELFKYTIKKCNCYISDIIGILIEVQKDNVSDLTENLKRKDRINFYRRLGAKVLDGVNYLLPPQNGGDLEEMYLMMKPVTGINSLAKLSVFQYIKAIYTIIYQYQNDELLSMIFRNLPTKIPLSDLVI